MTEAILLVTVLTPVYNAAALIAQTVESILTQNDPRLQNRKLLSVAFTRMTWRRLRYRLGAARHA